MCKGLEVPHTHCGSSGAVRYSQKAGAASVAFAGCKAKRGHVSYSRGTLVTRATRREKAAAAVREGLELEAAEVLAARIAEGRPPDSVWAAAARRRARRGPEAGGWYTSAPPCASPRASPCAQPPPLTETRHGPLVLRVVRLPERLQATAPLR